DPDPTNKFDYGHWRAAVHHPETAELARKDDDKSPEHMTLGRPNPSDWDQSVRLYDRFADRDAAQRSILYNVNEFDHIARITNVVDAETGLPAEGRMISAELNQLLEEPPKEVKETQYPGDASVHFDFRTPPWMFGSAANMGPDEAEGAQVARPYPTGDVRAMKLLDCLTFLTGPARIPGQINVNTAPAEVLATIPIFDGRPWWVGGILAYRWRTTSMDPRIPTTYQSGLYDFSDSWGPAARYPGYGIRSMGELEIPLSFTFSDAPNLDQREALWSDAVNMCTVRSDTFVVYGYLEAVRQNPRFAGRFDNARVWYQMGNAVTDDPGNTSAPLQRMGRRRWVAIMDRSENSASKVRLDGLGVDESFRLPRVLAVKNMAE
ncbi:MAG TPA: hypothetical protein VGN88_13570, partial [Phycisphaerae bacterium]